MQDDHVLNLMHAHRSIRLFKPEPVLDADIRRAVEAGQAASTSSAIQGYCLIQIHDDDRRKKLIELTGRQEKVASAGAFFVVCGDTRRHRLCCESAGTTYEARLEAFLLCVIDATLFAQNVVLAFESMGYGICYIGGLRNDLAAVQKLLQFPEGVYPLYGLCVGLPDEAPMPRPRLPVDAVLHHDAYPDDDSMRALISDYDRDYLAYLDERGVSERSRRPWSSIIAGQFDSPGRTAIGPYYTRQGADLR